ncbi:MAG TPA: hypothetical protein VK569_10140 [Bacteroidota bacterium]|nr:hypothetical protein [Bacteroidota bacterium]
MKGVASPADGGGEAGPSATMRPRTRMLLSFLLGATVFVLYAPLAQFPFVQDDWSLLHFFRFHDAPSAILAIFTPGARLFFRPLAFTYCWIVYSLFGLHPAGFHLLSIFFLAGSSFVVVSIAGKLTGDRVVAWGSGFLYAAASNVHLDPQMWLVGAFDIGGGLFALLSIDSFARKRFSLSALWFAAALGFKESTVMVLFVLAVWTVLEGRDTFDAGHGLLARFQRLKWHGVALLAFAAARIPGIVLFALPDTHPYAARLTGTHIGRNFQDYSLWGLQAVTPLKSVLFSENGAVMTLFITTAALVLVFISGARHIWGKGSARRGPVMYSLMILAWYLLMLCPSLTLVHQINRYYLTEALPPLVIGTILLLKITLLNAGRSARFILYAAMTFAALNVMDGTVSLYRRVGLGALDGIHASGRDGDNHLIRKAATVQGVWTRLMNVLPSLPPHSLLFLEDGETAAFAHQYGLQVWYGDSTLLLTGSLPVGPDSLGMVRAEVVSEGTWNAPEQTTVVSVPASRTVHVRITQERCEVVRDGPPAR